MSATPHFHTSDAAAERSTRWVLAITVGMMGVEVAGGWAFNSMALLADGWHMGSHALAIGLTVIAYAATRRYASDPRFAFGTWKIEVLAAFASAIGLMGVAALMLVGSVEQLLVPRPIAYRESMAIAVVGLVVNIVCALILARGHHHDHDHGHDHGHGHHHDHHGHDLNLRSAYLHVLADAATSVLAVLALAGGWVWGWAWLDPAMGMVGAALVAAWSWGLIRQTSAVLLDREMDHPVVVDIREVVASLREAPRVLDLRVWRVGGRAYACNLVLADAPPGLTPDDVREALGSLPMVVHAVIEVRSR